MQESHLKIFHCKSMSATPSHIPRNPETKKINLNNFHLDKVVQQPDDVASARSSHHWVLLYQHHSLLTLPVVYCFCHSSAERRIKSKISQSACFLCAGPRQNTPPDCPPAPAEVFLFRLSLMDIWCCLMLGVISIQTYVYMVTGYKGDRQIQIIPGLLLLAAATADPFGCHGPESQGGILKSEEEEKISRPRKMKLDLVPPLPNHLDSHETPS